MKLSSLNCSPAARIEGDYSALPEKAEKQRVLLVEQLGDPRSLRVRGV